MALPLLLTGGLALSACSFGAGTADDTAGATRTTTAAPTTSAVAGTPTATPAAGSGAPTATGGATAAPEPSGADPTTAGGPDRCHTSELTGRLTAGDAAAGQRGATLTLTDTGGEVCTVFGYGGLGLLGSDGAALPTAQNRLASPAPRTVTLQPGQAVSTVISWTVIPTGDETCPTATTLQVIPPDETDALSVTWVGAAVCGGGELSQNAYTAA